MTTKLPKTCIATLLIALFVGVFIVGCISAPEQPVVVPNATIVSPQNDDFTVLISKDGWPPPKNPINIIAKNFSEIVANNYADIPNLLEMDYEFFDGYIPIYNHSKIAGVALHDSRIQKVLRDKGVVQGLSWGPAYSIHSRQMVMCNKSVTLEFVYRGQHETALINETTGVVILDPGLEQNLTERWG